MMFHPALWKLISLQWKGGFRQFLRSLRTFRGLFQLAFIVAILTQNKITMYFAGSWAGQTPAVVGPIEKFMAAALFACTVYIVLFSSGESTVYFTASEVAFLFPAPFSRKQILAYKLLKSLLGIIALSFIFALLSTSQIGMILPRWFAIVLTMSFIQLLTMNVAFARHVMREKMHLMIRQVVGLIIALILVVALNQLRPLLMVHSLKDYEKILQELTEGSPVLEPFRAFSRAIFAPDWITFVPWASILVVIDGLLLVLAFRLDALSLEVALAVSEKMTARIKLMQTKGIWQGFGATSSVARRRIPLFPHWSGIGPIVWQRMTTMFRTSTKLLWLLAGAVALATFAVYQIAQANSDAKMAPFAGLGFMCYVSLLITLTLQNEIEHVGYLKSLPLRTRSIVLGEVIGVPILLSVIQLLFIIGEACFFPDFAGWLIPAACLTFPFNFLLAGVDKLVFYVYPTRLAKGTPGDFQNAGKQMIYMTLKMLTIFAAFAIVGISVLPGAILLESPIVSVASAVIVMLIECAVLVPLLVVAFDRFDPGVTMVS